LQGIENELGDAVGDNHTPGPYSKGVTDENGIFTLKTRYDEPGAVAGPHKVGFAWDDIEFDSMSTLKEELADSSGDAARTAAAQQGIDELKQKIQSRPKLDFRKVFGFEVPNEGTASADFELGE
jgi:hypothetical protein